MLVIVYAVSVEAGLTLRQTSTRSFAQRNGGFE